MPENRGLPAEFKEFYRINPVEHIFNYFWLYNDTVFAQNRTFPVKLLWYGSGNKERLAIYNKSGHRELKGFVTQDYDQLSSWNSFEMANLGMLYLQEMLEQGIDQREFKSLFGVGKEISASMIRSIESGGKEMFATDLTNGFPELSTQVYSILNGDLVEGKAELISDMNCTFLDNGQIYYVKEPNTNGFGIFSGCSGCMAGSVCSVNQNHILNISVPEYMQNANRIWRDYLSWLEGTTFGGNLLI